jgi:hypothetical protein
MAARTARLGRVFDAMLIHDAIMHMTTADDLAGAGFAPTVVVDPWAWEVFVGRLDSRLRSGSASPSGDTHHSPSSQ